MALVLPEERVSAAIGSISIELRLFANTIAAEERADFFHPCNRDLWVREFCSWLSEKQRKSAEVRASND